MAFKKKLNWRDQLYVKLICEAITQKLPAQINRYLQTEIEIEKALTLFKPNKQNSFDIYIIVQIHSIYIYQFCMIKKSFKTFYTKSFKCAKARSWQCYYINIVSLYLLVLYLYQNLGRYVLNYIMKDRQSILNLLQLNFF